MKLFVYPNLLSLDQIRTTREVLDILINDLKYDVSISKEDSLKVYGNEEFFKFDVKECDYIISLGGDACVLKTAQIAFKNDKPLLGINAGRLGYLCAIKKEDIKDLTEEKIRSMTVNELSVLNLHFKHSTHYVFNDVVIGKTNFGKTISVIYQVDYDDPISFRGDGLIIATPLGSTGYSLSAGGSKISLNEDKIAVTPICPHFTDNTSKVVSGGSVISINSPFSYENKTGVYVDGEFVGELKEMISVSKNNKKLLLLR